MMALGKICVLFPNMLSWNKNSKIILFVLLPRRLWWHRWELVIGVACLLVNQWEMCQWKGKAVPTGRQIFILKSENRNREGSPFSIFCFDHWRQKMTKKGDPLSDFLWCVYKWKLGIKICVWTTFLLWPGNYHNAAILGNRECWSIDSWFEI